MISFTVPGEARGKGRRGRGYKVASDAALIDAYARLGNIHKVGAEVGIRGSSVHERLVRLGAAKPMRVLSEADAERIRAYYETTPAETFDPRELAAELGRTLPFISRQAGKMGLTNMKRRMTSKRLVENAKRPAANCYSRSKRGHRDDLGETYFRSSWEANYARYLNWLLARGEIESWEFEPETFWFEKIKRGVRSYLPDFRIHEKGRSYFVEVKGWMDDVSKTKLKRMRIYHPHVEVRVVARKEYFAIQNALGRIIPHWEGLK